MSGTGVICCQGCTKQVQLHGSLIAMEPGIVLAGDSEFVLVGSPKTPTGTFTPELAGSAIVGQMTELLERPEAREFDHPLCLDCANNLSISVSRRLEDMRKQERAYSQLLEQLEKEQRLGELVVAEDIAQLECEEEELLAEIEEVEKQRELVRCETGFLEGEAKKMAMIEEKYWESYNAYQRDLQLFQEARETVRMKLLYTDSQLHKLMKTNVYNDTFHIWHDGHFGTINNFRLGRLPSQPVDWNEINAAWGQAALLLHRMAEKMDFKFSTYTIIPNGSFSKIERRADKTRYDLFGSNDVSLGRLFWYRRFEAAMVGYLRCLKDLAEYASTLDPQFALPYKINQETDRIGEMSIKNQFNNDQHWTKALKFLLIDLKCLLAWLSKFEASGPTP